MKKMKEDEILDMNVSEHQLRELIKEGEGLTGEFKTCRDQLSRDVYETVCAFLNRHGGTLVLGVQDSGEVHHRIRAGPHGEQQQTPRIWPA